MASVKTDNSLAKVKKSLHAHKNAYEKSYVAILEKTSLALAPQKLRAAILYSLKGGKRFRAALIMEAGKLTQATKLQLHYLAIAIECLHTYTLVHDDLPALDNDNYRRGHLTTHSKYGEDVGILVGDALQTLAFELLAKSKITPEGLQYFCSSIGASGTVGGQYLDIRSSTKRSYTYLEKMHFLKTGKLIEASVALPFYFSQTSSLKLKRIKLWALQLGLLFQIGDDYLDVTKKSTTGKTSGKDLKLGKLTFATHNDAKKLKEKADAIHDKLITEANKLFPQLPFYHYVPSLVLHRSK